MHAYLVMVHKNINQVKKLLELLDYYDNDIYIHVDRKAKKEIVECDFSVVCRHSKVYQYSEIDVYWGNVSQIKCELFLLEQAKEHKQYQYYHLISGMDLPLKTQKEIHQFFDLNSGKEFVNFSGEEKTAGLYIEDRVRYYWATRWYGILRIKYSQAIMRRLDLISVKLQKLLGVNRLDKEKRLYHGANWFSITDDLVSELLRDKNLIFKQYKASNCADEVFIQTFIMENAKYWENLYIPKINNGFRAILRDIDWKRGAPYTWHKEDFEELVNSDFLFARKFDENVDSEIIDMIYDYIVGGSENDKNER